MPKSGRSDTLIVLIGIFKLVKAAILVGVATGALELLHRSETGKPVFDLLTFLPVERYGPVARWLSDQIAALTPHKLEIVTIAAYVYAALFVLEGVGLLLRKRWGEIVTIIITASFIPLEVYEAIHHFTAGKIVALVLNIGIVAYLAWRLKTGGK